VSCSGDMECYCQYAPSYDALKNQEDATSGWTNCYIGGGGGGGGTPANSCFGATCASGDWVPSNYFSADEKFVEATDGADCLNQCGQMGYTSANMPVSCSGDMECYCQYAPSYDELKNQEDATSDWTNCYIGGGAAF